ncbi:FMRFamide receptor-like [Planococcus citri]|uniref:FMRFamide receptor-like n=1 Tax=Planococcus citri TaxID=170843 RepID=UPI0031F9A917
MSTEKPYCGMTMPKIGEYYKDNIYSYLSTPLCLIGIILNLLNILIFTRKTMISPAHLIFAHLAFADFLVLLARIPYTWLMQLQLEDRLNITQHYGRIVFYLGCDTFIVTYQTISKFLTVQLAVWRYIAVVHPFKERQWCTMEITRRVMFAGYIIWGVLFPVPYYLSTDVQTINPNHENYEKILTAIQHPIISLVVNIVLGLIIRILPSIVLAGLTFKIVVTLLARKKYQEQFTACARNPQHSNRSTFILVAVVVLFFIAEFPKGVLSLLRVICDNEFNEFYKPCYASLIPIFNTITNLNLSITFFVYYILSENFRITLKSLFSCNAHESHQELTPLS